MDMLPEFERLGVDPCGERGEYHTVVTRSPLFREPLALALGDRVSRSGCWALDVSVQDVGARHVPGTVTATVKELHDV
jgi:diphthamide synthase (EF-2-diphthine--ammonia ligase)